MRFILVRTGSLICNKHNLVKAGDVVIMAPDARCSFEPEGQATVTTIEANMDLIADLFRWRFTATLATRVDAADMLTCRYPDPVFTVPLGEERMGMISPHADNLVTLTIDEHAATRFYRLVSDLTAVLDVLLVGLLPLAQSGHGKASMSPTCAGRRSEGIGARRDEARTIERAFTSDVARSWHLAELAELVHLSPSQVRRVMIASYGRTPLAHLNRLRAEELARLIRETDISLTTAYHRVGWVNRAHAARMFAQVLGMRPAEYAQRYRRSM